jgi:hypothetical protein
MHYQALLLLSHIMSDIYFPSVHCFPTNSTLFYVMAGSPLDTQQQQTTTTQKQEGEHQNTKNQQQS